MSKPGAGPASGISLGDAWYSPSGIRHVGGANLNRAPVRNVRTWPAMPREKAQAAPTVRLKVPMRRRGADCPVVVMKRGNARGAKGAGHRHWIGSTSKWEEPARQWKAAAFMRWHEPYESRGSRTESVRGSG